LCFKNTKNTKNTGDGFLYPHKTFIYKGFRKKWGQALFTMVLDPLQECPKYAPRGPLNGLQFSKKWQLRSLFLAYFCLPKITKPL
jgi:hypothetical protein